MNFIYLTLTFSFVISQKDISEKKQENGNENVKGGVKKKSRIDYCAINKEHILCGANGSTVLMKGIKEHYPTLDDHRETFLNTINKQRDLVASGLMRRRNFTFPVAANMFELKWSTQFERAAYNGIKNCLDNETYRNCCNCMNTGKTDLSVQRLMTLVYDRTGDSLQQIIDHTIKPINGTPFTIECVENITAECLIPDSFFLRLINARTVQIGCVYVQCPFARNSDKSKHWVDSYMSCVSNLDYYQDILYHPLYKQGSSCSNCPNGSSCSKNYTNLCLCEKISDCLITPSELKTECTERKKITEAPKSTLATPVVEVNTFPILPIQVPTDYSVVTTTTSTTIQKTSDSGGIGDKTNLGLNFDWFENVVFSLILSTIAIIN